MLRLSIAAAVLAALPCLAAPNLLTNPRFEFHAFENHRLGSTVSFTSHNVAFWNTEAWGDITVTRESHVDPKIRPAFSTGSLVSLALRHTSLGGAASPRLDQGDEMGAPALRA